MSEVGKTNLYEIPRDWEWVKLGEVCTNVEYGSSAKSKETGKVPVLRMGNIQNGKFVLEDLVYTNEQNEIDKYLLKEGDVLFNRTNSAELVGKTAIYKGNKPAIFAGYLIRINIIKSLIDPAYLTYFLNTTFARVYGNMVKSYGVNQSNINGTKLKTYPIPLAPISTQKQIVSKIEELFSELDKSIDQLKTAQQQLKVYRQSVLKWAFEGKITNENVKEGELPHGWTWVKLGEVCKSVEYGSSAKSKEIGKIPVLRMGNIQRGRFDWSDLVYTDNEEEINKYLLKRNDVLFNRTNSPELVGKTAIYKGERPAIFAGYLIRINRNEDQINADYLNYFLNTDVAKHYGNSVKTDGVNQSNINGQKLKTYPIPLAPLDEQIKVVQEIETRISVADKLEETIANSLQKAEALRQSIFKKAFEGKL